MSITATGQTRQDNRQPDTSMEGFTREGSTLVECVPRPVAVFRADRRCRRCRRRRLVFLGRAICLPSGRSRSSGSEVAHTGYRPHPTRPGEPCQVVAAALGQYGFLATGRRETRP
jgi:hypothetical protein